MLAVAGLDHLGNVYIPLICDNAFRVVIQFLFGRCDIRFNMLQGIRRDLQLLQHLVIPLEHLDGIPALLFFRQAVDSSFLNMGERVLHRSGEGVLRNRLRLFRRLDRRFRRLHDAGSLQGGNLHNLAAQLTGQVRCIQLIAVLFHHVHHVDGHHHGNAKLYQLRRQVEVALQVGAVDDVQDRVGPLIDQVIPGNHFLQRIGRQAVDPRQVRNRDSVMLFQLAFLFFHRYARPVADKLVGPGQRVEQGRFSAVRVARKGDSEFHGSSLLLLYNTN